VALEGHTANVTSCAWSPDGTRQGLTLVHFSAQPQMCLVTAAPNYPAHPTNGAHVETGSGRVEDPGTRLATASAAITKTVGGRALYPTYYTPLTPSS